MSERGSGILLHITSLPGPGGIGTFGADAFRFIDFLKENGQKFWQILPIGEPEKDNSPYQCYSTFAGNPLLINLDNLVEESLLSKADLPDKRLFPTNYVDFQKVKIHKQPLLKKSFINFTRDKHHSLKEEYDLFQKKQKNWIEDYALFMAAKEYFKSSNWYNWKKPLKYRDKSALEKYRKLLSQETAYHKFIQFIFFRQYISLKKYANSKNIKIIGDLPYYVAGESADIWANTEIFLLDKKDLNPIRVGGVPPDYFSETGQLWGNPVYDWKQIEKMEFDWWISRLTFNLELFDYLRLDHFRGFHSYWSVPAKDKTAINGEWLPAGGNKLFKKLKTISGDLPLIAEDLGIFEPGMEELRKKFKIPGMRVLQFAFSTDENNKNLPHNYFPECIAYTGTHDNNTTRGWLCNLKGKEKKLVDGYLGKGKKEKFRRAIELIWASCAQITIIPMQDVLMLGSAARFNIPGTSSDNWSWRLKKNPGKSRKTKYLKEITKKYNRHCSAT